MKKSKLVGAPPILHPMTARVPDDRVEGELETHVLGLNQRIISRSI